ncbi:DUF2946 family protein [Alcaligenes faecalis]|uniref:DUF2946 family protein n=1 Tax=Alcaligenes faecalis TaxID=511 RepID=UPI000F0BC9E6|nr:DUF2946 family protein [Alcaligenes faecalis]AYR19174.1 DUF2946 domain-containing protein [Alcaligenes faecalis]
MHALGPRFVFREIRVWQFLFCLAVLAYVCRAIIPAGYMPSRSAQDKGFAITFCTAGNVANTFWIDLIGQDGQADSDTHQNQQDCPFGIAASPALLPTLDAPVLISLLTYRPVLLADRHPTRPSLPALGPPLGSRAPPFPFA